MATKIIRKPIQISPHTIVVMQIFNRHDHLADLWTSDVEQLSEEKFSLYQEAAEQFIEQLEERWCKHFLSCLRNEIDKRVARDV